ncbi:MAG: DUF3667 domain-containing protein [Pseudomonadota bacterium]
MASDLENAIAAVGDTAPGKADAEPVRADRERPEAVMGPCLSCGAAAIGEYCAQCGQKNDDLRRSVFLLGRDFIEDTFAFDSRMWRTLGRLATAPGVVPKDYAHGRRSRYTPPIRLFLIVSLLFFLTLSATQTLFLAVEISEANPSGLARLTLDTDDGQTQVSSDDNDFPDECRISASFSFFVRVSDLNPHDKERWERCAVEIQNLLSTEFEKARSRQTESGDAMTEAEFEQATQMSNAILSGVTKAIADPQAINAAFNNWLPRIMFLMTPVLALILSVFIRGRDALFFDHMVLSIYSHAVGFAAVGFAVLLAHAGAPLIGPVVSAALLVYAVLALKRTYGRGWIKTIYTAVMSSVFYLFVLFGVVFGIVIFLILPT